MPGFTTGLTSLKDPRANDGRSFIRPENRPPSTPAVNKIAALEAELERLEGAKEKLKGEIGGLVEERNKNAATITAEINVLKRTKLKLLSEVQDVGKTHFALKEAKSKGETAFNDFFSSRQNFLVGFSSKVLDEITHNLEKITQESIRYEEVKGTAEKTVVDASLLKNEAQNALQRVAEAKGQLEIEAKHIFDQKEQTKIHHQKAVRLSTEAEKKHKQAEKILAAANENKKETDKYVAQAREKADQQLEDLRKVALAQNAKEQYFDQLTHRLKERERLINDREAAARRLAAEVRSWKRK